MDGSNTTDNGFDNEAALNPKRPRSCVFVKRKTNQQFNECGGCLCFAYGMSLGLLGFCELKGNMKRPLNPAPQREAESGHISQS